MRRATHAAADNFLHPGAETGRASPADIGPSSGFCPGVQHSSSARHASNRQDERHRHAQPRRRGPPVGEPRLRPNPGHPRVAPGAPQGSGQEDRLLGRGTGDRLEVRAALSRRVQPTSLQTHLSIRTIGV